MEFRDLINFSPVEGKNKSEEARFSFMQGRYVEGFDLQGRFYSISYTLLLDTQELVWQIEDACQTNEECIVECVPLIYELLKRLEPPN